MILIFDLTVHCELRAITKFKQKLVIMNQTGNTGPPDTSMERSLRY